MLAQGVKGDLRDGGLIFMEKTLSSIPVKRYFTIGEVSELCGVKPYVLRYWEQEFSQLKPMKRRGNRRYYQRHEVLLIRRIRELLYDEGFTISGARNRLSEGIGREGPSGHAPTSLPGLEVHEIDSASLAMAVSEMTSMVSGSVFSNTPQSHASVFEARHASVPATLQEGLINLSRLREALISIRETLT